MMQKKNRKKFPDAAGIFILSLFICGIFILMQGGMFGDVMAISQTDVSAASVLSKRESSGTAGETENDRAHKAYIRALKENSYKKTPDLCMAQPSGYSFYDIDGNGVDELLTYGGYFANAFFTYQDGKIVYLCHEKYGGNFRIYPEKGIIELPDGGHMDHYYASFIRVDGTRTKCAAEKDWVVHYLNRSGSKTKTTYKYKLSGKRVTKAKYEKYVRALKKTKVVKRKQLTWKKVSALRLKRMKFH